MLYLELNQNYWSHSNEGFREDAQFTSLLFVGNFRQSQSTLRPTNSSCGRSLPLESKCREAHQKMLTLPNFPGVGHFRWSQSNLRPTKKCLHFQLFVWSTTSVGVKVPWGTPKNACTSNASCGRPLQLESKYHEGTPNICLHFKFLLRPVISVGVEVPWGNPKHACANYKFFRRLVIIFGQMESVVVFSSGSAPIKFILASRDVIVQVWICRNIFCSRAIFDPGQGPAARAHAMPRAWLLACCLARTTKALPNA